MEQSCDAPQLVVVTRRVLGQYQQPFGLLVVGGGGDGEHGAGPAVVNGDDGLRDLARNRRLGRHATGGLGDGQFAGTDVELWAGDAFAETVGALCRVGRVDHVKDLVANRLFLGGGQIRRGLFGRLA